MGIGYVPQGGEFQVNTTTTGYQNGSSVTVFDDGSFVVVWASQGDGGVGSGFGVYAQRYDSTGHPLGLETRVNTTTAGDQKYASVSALNDGGYVVTWTSSNQDGSGMGVYAQRYDASGIAQGTETRVNTTTANDQSTASVAGLADGGYVIVWQSNNQDGSGNGVYAQRYNASGVAQGSETLVSTTTAGAQFDGAVTGLAGGGYVVTWTSTDATGFNHVYLQRFDASGVPQGSETLVGTGSSDETQASVAALDGGGFVITWKSYTADGGDIHAQRFDAAGVAQGGETLVNTTTAGAQDFPSVSALASGGYVIVWQSPDANSTGVYAQAFDASGNPAGAETLINATTDSAQQVLGGSYRHPVAARPDGGFVVTWTSPQDGSNSGVEARLFTTTTLNYAPAGTDKTVTLDEDASHALTAADFGFSDSDGNSFSGVLIATLPANGALTLDGAAVTAGEFVTAADIAAGHLVFAPDANEHGDAYASFTFQVRDDGGTANGGVDTDATPNTISFDIESVPDGASQMVSPVGDVLTISDGNSNTGSGVYGITYPEMAKLADGNVIVVGTGSGQIVGRILSPDGQALTDDILLVANNGSEFSTLAVTALDGGGFAIAYIGDAGHEMLGIYDSTGQAVGDPIEVTTAGSSGDIALTQLDSGNLLVGSLSSTGYFAQIYDLAGTQVAHFAITTSGGSRPDFAATPDGGFYAAWVDGNNVVGRQFTSTGTPESAATILAQASLNGGASDPSVALLADGTIAVAYRLGTTTTISGASAGALGVFVKLIHPDGTIDPAVTVTPVTETTAGRADVNDEQPHIVALPDGGFAVGFASNDNYGGYGGWNYYVATFDADGNRLTGNQLVSGAEGTADVFGDVVALDDGSILAAWGQGDGTHGRLLTPTVLAGSFIYGDDGANALTGTARGEVIDGGGGDDQIDGGAGGDVMRGGTGNDTYFVDDRLDSVIETSNTGGDDTAIASADFRLAEGLYVEHLVAAAGSAPIGLTGNRLDQSLTGNAGDNVLDGGGGDDTFAGGAGNDTYVILGDRSYGFFQAANLVVENPGEGIDTVIVINGDYTLPDNVENLTNTQEAGGAFQSLSGNGLDNVITGGQLDALYGLGGNDTLVRSSGYGTMAGGIGDDIYVLANPAETITENAGEGTDDVRVASNYTLGSNLENLTGIGSVGLTLTGNALANRIVGTTSSDNLSGNDGNDTLNGGAGSDSMAGGTGNDTFYVDNAGDTVSENADEGDDVVISSVSYTLGANVERLSLIGGNINGTGNADANTIVGNGGSNQLSGLDGNDHLDGGSGDDTLLGGVGDDTLLGGVGIDSLDGGIGNDLLNGGSGGDAMAGGAGNDTYLVDNIGDTVTEAGGGIDLVQSSISFTLNGNVENLTLTGSGLINGGGNALNNTITGNSYANVLNGNTGADTLIGAGGNDTYYVDNVGDVVTENAGEGNDAVVSSISWTLGSNVERLSLIGGAAAINGTGNDDSNTIVGNNGDNQISGLGANDTIDGGAGNDSLLGGTGSDTLNGNIGNDTLDGGWDRDFFTGGTGSDSFVFRDGDFAGLTSSTSDVIRDFSSTDGDQIDLHFVDANSANGGATNEAFSFIGSDAFHNVAGELRYHVGAGFTYVYGDRDGDGIADFMIRLDGSHALTSADFVL